MLVQYHKLVMNSQYCEISLAVVKGTKIRKFKSHRSQMIMKQASK